MDTLFLLFTLNFCLRFTVGMETYAVTWNSARNSPLEMSNKDLEGKSEGDLTDRRWKRGDLRTNCNTWHPWVNNNHPGPANNFSDTEKFSKKEFDEFCPGSVGGKVTQFQCADDSGEPRALGRLTDTLTYDGECTNITEGVRCWILNNMDGSKCPDMKIRVYCSCPEYSILPSIATNVPDSTQRSFTTNTPTILASLTTAYGVPDKTSRSSSSEHLSNSKSASVITTSTHATTEKATDIEIAVTTSNVQKSTGTEQTTATTTKLTTGHVFTLRRFSTNTNTSLQKDSSTSGGSDTNITMDPNISIRHYNVTNLRHIFVQHSQISVTTLTPSVTQTEKESIATKLKHYFPYLLIAVGLLIMIPLISVLGRHVYKKYQSQKVEPRHLKSMRTLRGHETRACVVDSKDIDFV